MFTYFIIIVDSNNQEISEGFCLPQRVCMSKMDHIIAEIMQPIQNHEFDASTYSS